MLVARILLHLIFASTKICPPLKKNKSFPPEKLSLTSSTVKDTSHLEGFPAGGPAPSWEEWVQALASGEVRFSSKLDQ